MHPNVEKKYKENEFEHYETTHERTVQLFNEKVKQYRNPITKEINSIYRIRKGNKEHFFYHQTTRSTDGIGNMFYKFETIGKYEDPKFTYNYDPSSGQRIATQILNQKTVYELEWPEDWTPELEKLFTEECNSL